MTGAYTYNNDVMISCDGLKFIIYMSIQHFNIDTVHDKIFNIFCLACLCNSILS